MLYTTYKKGIEEFDKTDEFKDICKKLALREETVSGIDEICLLKNFINILLKFQAIKSNEEEIELLKSKFKDNSDETRNRIEKDGFGYLVERLVGYNIAIQDQISHLQTQNKLIEEDKN